MAEYRRKKRTADFEPDAADGHRISDPESLRHLDNLKGPERTLPENFRREASQRLGGFDMGCVKVFEDPGLDTLGQQAYAHVDEIHVAAAHLAQQSAGQAQGLEAGARHLRLGQKEEEAEGQETRAPKAGGGAQLSYHVHG